MDKNVQKLCEIHAEQFKDHVVTLTQDGSFARLVWQNCDGSNICRIVYMWRGGLLLIYGDMGDAVFTWYGVNLNLSFLGSVNIDYMLSKCQASEVGRDFRQWNSDAAEDWVKFFNEDREDYGLPPLTADQKEGIQHACQNQHEWLEFIQSTEGEKAFGEDIWESWDVGLIPHTRFVAMWLGLRLAARQLNAAAKKEAAA